jgi:hypothetical protein
MITANFEIREWKDGDAEAVARSKKYWAIQRNRVSRAIEMKERNKVEQWASNQVRMYYESK